MNSDAEKWDAKELVTEKVLQRKQVKDVRGAATRLLNFEEEAKLNVQSRGQQNPVYSEPVYGSMLCSTFCSTLCNTLCSRSHGILCRMLRVRIGNTLCLV